MIEKEVIDEVKNRLVKVYDPVAIYLFGSYAWGTPTEDSDLDLLVVVATSDEKDFKRSIPGQMALFGLGISKDIIVFTKEEFNLKLKDMTSLSHRIEKYGELLYAKS